MDLTSLACPLIVGMFMGFAYTRGCMLQLKMAGFLATMLAACAALSLVGLWFNSVNLAGSGAIASGISLVALFRVWRLSRRLPNGWKRPLPRRQSASTPEIYGDSEGNWSLVYPDGQTYDYDTTGSLREIRFPDGRQWQLIDGGR